jgi:hypothetical protein
MVVHSVQEFPAQRPTNIEIFENIRKKKPFELQQQGHRWV